MIGNRWMMVIASIGGVAPETRYWLTWWTSEEASRWKVFNMLRPPTRAMEIGTLCGILAAASPGFTVVLVIAAIVAGIAGIDAVDRGTARLRSYLLSMLLSWYLITSVGFGLE
jgi:hypothetical protein